MRNFFKKKDKDPKPTAPKPLTKNTPGIENDFEITTFDDLLANTQPAKPTPQNNRSGQSFQAQSRPSPIEEPKVNTRNPLYDTNAFMDDLLA
jgi:hypothetical protein